jgi:predicted alpha/beta superfamily hydrolase
MKIQMTFLLSIMFFLTHAQVTIIVDSVPAYTPEQDELYIVGSFNNWNPGDTNYKLQLNENNLPEIVLNGFSEGTTIEYKFTRGSWDTVEKGSDGEEISNRTFTFSNGETVRAKIYNWADNTNSGGGGGNDNSTAAENVIVMDENFYIPQLDRYRRIILYLPPDYDNSQNAYPVLYMHDGQNLFDVLTAYAGEWEVDETLNALAAEGYTVPIVVGIDNSQHRADEYLPYYNPNFAGGEGDEYAAFITETLKPHIDANYRTLPDRENTGIMGSSLGAVISLYAAVRYQEVFSKAGLFSPAYWANYDQIWGFLKEEGNRKDIHFYQNIGQHEGDQYIQPMYQMQDSLNALGFQNVSSKIIEDGQHNEATWAADFAEAYLWLYNTGTSNTESIKKNARFRIYPNPTNNFLKIVTETDSDRYRISITDMAGKLQMEVKDVTKKEIDIRALKSGIYFIRIHTDKASCIERFIKVQ